MDEDILIDVKNEIQEINSKMIFEYSKIIDDLKLEEICILNFEDNNMTMNFLFYGSDFFAYNRVNFKDGYNYNKSKDFIEISENLNNRIKKIPNVAKTRSILKLEDIEARIYDMSDFILLLSKNDKKILKVNSDGSLKDVSFESVNIDINKTKELVEKYKKQEEETIKEEKSLKNKLKRFNKSIKEHLINPLIEIKNKLFKVNEVKLLSDGKHSIFDKQD